MSSSPQEKILRPPNAFIIYRSFIGTRLPPPPLGTTRNQRDVSKIAGEMWRGESQEVKDNFRRQAVLAKAEHMAKYPDYKFGCTPKNGRGGSKKGKGTQGEVVVHTSRSSNFYGAVGSSEGTHYSPPLPPEISGNSADIYPDYCEAVFESYHPPYNENVFSDGFNASPDHHEAGFVYYPSPSDENGFSTWLTDQNQLQPQGFFGDEQDLWLQTLQGLSYEQLSEPCWSV